MFTSIVLTIVVCVPGRCVSKCVKPKARIKRKCSIESFHGSMWTPIVTGKYGVDFNMDFCFVNKIESHFHWFVNLYFKKF